MLEMTASSLATSISTVLIFSIIPVIWWVALHRKDTGFFEWIGIKVPHMEREWWVLAIFAVVYLASYFFDFSQFVDPETLTAMSGDESMQGSGYAGIGALAILPALIECFIANGLAEETLFRGFLCKRLCAKFGSAAGIILQAVLFGLMHNILFLLGGLEVGLTYHAVAFASAAVGALLLGFLNEKIFNGSIIPSILLHGTGNFVSTMLVAFNL